MERKTPTREEALAILKEFNQGEKAMRHALAVEAVNRYLKGVRRNAVS
jgi:predicted hydrolase (HD superfamily)